MLQTPHKSNENGQHYSARYLVLCTHRSCHTWLPSLSCNAFYEVEKGNGAKLTERAAGISLCDSKAHFTVAQLSCAPLNFNTKNMMMQPCSHAKLKRNGIVNHGINSFLQQFA